MNANGKETINFYLINTNPHNNIVLNNSKPLHTEETTGHIHSDNFWDRYFELLTDPAHWLFEITVTLTVDVLVGFIILKKIVIPKVKRALHKEIDKEHGYPEHE